MGSLELALDQIGLQVEETERPELVATGSFEQVPQRLAGDRAPTEPGDHRAAASVAVRQRFVYVGGDDPAAPDRQRLLEDHHAAGAGKRLADLVEREGAERLDAEGADPDAGVAQVVDHRLDRP